MVERTSKFLLIVVGSVFFMMILYQYVAPGVMNFGSPQGYLAEDNMDIFPTPDPHYVKKYYFPVRDLERTVDFEIKGEDVIVFLHIQKTGGTTFGRHLVQNVRLEVPCDCRPGQKKCTCYRPNRKETWLFSRFSTGWSCGLHADWTELTNCVPGVLNKRENKSKKLRYVRNVLTFYISLKSPQFCFSYGHCSRLCRIRKITLSNDNVIHP